MSIGTKLGVQKTHHIQSIHKYGNDVLSPKEFLKRRGSTNAFRAF